MPVILNNSGEGSIASSLRDLGESLFANGARNELTRQQATKVGRDNQYAEPFASAARSGDRGAMAYYGAMRGLQGADAANWALLGTANNAKGIDDPGLATAQIGAHEPISSTAVGQRRT